MKMRATPQELAAVKNAMKQEKVPRVQRRFRALYLFLCGKTCKEVGQAIGVTPITVSNINRNYKNLGIEGLRDKVKSGRPSRLSSEQQDELKETVLYKHPADAGFPERKEWTAGLIGDYIRREYGYEYSVRGITRMLEHLGIVYIRPKYVLVQTDAERERNVPEDFSDQPTG